MKSVIIVLFCTMLLSVTLSATPFGMNGTGPPGITQVQNHDQTDVIVIDLNVSFDVNLEKHVVAYTSDRWQTDHNTILSEELREKEAKTLIQHNKGSTQLKLILYNAVDDNTPTDYVLRC